jgi:hypothetical protein
MYFLRGDSLHPNYRLYLTAQGVSSDLIVTYSVCPPSLMLRRAVPTAHALPQWFVTHEPSLFTDPSLFTQVVSAIHRNSVLWATNH